MNVCGIDRHSRRFKRHAATDGRRNVTSYAFSATAANGNIRVLLHDRVQVTGRVNVDAVSRQVDLLAEVIVKCDLPGFQSSETVPPICDAHRNRVIAIAGKR